MSTQNLKCDGLCNLATLCLRLQGQTHLRHFKNCMFVEIPAFFNKERKNSLPYLPAS